MAGAGYKLFNTGDVLTAAQVNTYLQEQSVMVFANAAARTSALTSVLAEGMVSYLQDTNAVEVYDGSAWVSIGASGDITGVTAGTGISGGGTSGTVTITNDMATTITAAGDIVVGTGSGTYDNLPIGSTGQVLTADTSVSPYKVKWATAAGGGGGLVKISSTTFSSVASQDFDSVFSSTYNTYLISLDEIYAATAADDLYLRFKYSSATLASGYYGGNWYISYTGSSGSYSFNNQNEMRLADNTGSSGSKGGGYFYFRTVGGSSAVGSISGQYYTANSAVAFSFGGDTQVQQTWTGFRLLTSSSNISGKVTVYGLEK